MSIHPSGGSGTLRRIVLSCDVAGCPVQLEPTAAEQWRSDADALSWARAHAVGWTCDQARQTDYCPEHAEFSTVGADVPPRPTAAARDRAGNPLDRDEYAAHLRSLLAKGGPSTGHPPMVTDAHAAVVARLLDELAGVYRGETWAPLRTNWPCCSTANPAGCTERFGLRRHVHRERARAPHGRASAGAASTAPAEPDRAGSMRVGPHADEEDTAGVRREGGVP